MQNYLQLMTVDGLFSVNINQLNKLHDSCDCNLIFKMYLFKNIYDFCLIISLQKKIVT